MHVREDRAHVTNGTPAFRAPALSCDAHFHIFGDPQRYPARDPKLRYQPPFAPLSEYQELAAKLGFERFVFVQPSAYARDNACMLEAMREMGGRCRGIVDIDEDTPEAELARLHAAGVRGVRVNVSPVHAPERGLAERLVPRVRRLESRLAELGWQLDFLLPGWLTAELIPVLRSLQVQFTLAHMGMFLARDGVSQSAFQQLLDLLKNGEGRCWVKLTGVYRMSQARGFVDAAPLARALIAAAPDRVIWGSDYPHLSFAGEVGSVELFNLLGAWAPDEATRRRILVDNPAKLYGF